VLLKLLVSPSSGIDVMSGMAECCICTQGVCSQVQSSMLGAGAYCVGVNIMSGHITHHMNL
jgi:hypothetical protein